MKNIFLFILFTAITLQVSAQLSIYQSNPLGWINKERIKLEYRINEQNSISLGTAAYWNLNNGFQTFLEYRKYFTGANNFERPDREFFLYGKIGGGNSGKDLTSANNEMYYSFLGGGVGWHFNLTPRFFLDLALGLKACSIESKDVEGYNILFQTFGPGSFIDANFHLGFNLYK